MPMLKMNYIFWDYIHQSCHLCTFCDDWSYIMSINKQNIGKHEWNFHDIQTFATVGKLTNDEQPSACSRNLICIVMQIATLEWKTFVRRSRALYARTYLISTHLHDKELWHTTSYISVMLRIFYESHLSTATCLPYWHEMLAFFCCRVLGFTKTRQIE